MRNKGVAFSERTSYTCIMTHACNLETTSSKCCDDLSGLLAPGFFKALSDPNRIALLLRLAGLGRASKVSEVAACCEVDLSVVSRHLATLRQAGILDAEKRGREVFYSVRYGELVTLLRSLADAIEGCCPDSSSDVGATCDTPRPNPLPIQDTNI